MKKSVILSLVTSLLGGCAAQDTVALGLQKIPLAAFQPSDSNANQRIYKETDVDLRQYNQVLLDPLQFIRNQNGQWYLLTVNEQNQIGRYYHDRFQMELVKNGVKIASAPGPGVVRVQVAITNFDLKRPDPKIRDLLPAKIAINITREVIEKELYLLNISSMSRLLDSQSGKQLVQVMDVRESNDTTYKSSSITSKEMEEMIDLWVVSRAKQLADNLGK